MLFELFFVWVFIEIFNYTYYYFMYQFISHQQYCRKNKKECTWMQQYIINKLNTKELEDMLKKAFSCTTPIKNISKSIGYDDVLNWCAYMLYARSMKQLSIAQLSTSNNCVKMIEKKLKINFSVKRNRNLKMLKFGNNDIRTKSKPAVYYGMIKIVKYLLYNVLEINGFKKFVSHKSGVTYFYKVSSRVKTHTLFVHGFGFGIIPYKSFINSLSHDENIIFPILPNISNIEYHSYFDSLNSDTLFPGRKIWNADFDLLINKFNIKKINLIAHSFGTIILSFAMDYFNKNNKINKIVLIEPVCFIEGSYKIYKYINDPYDQRSKMVSRFVDYIIYQDIYSRHIAQKFMHSSEFWIKNIDNLKTFKHYVVISENDQIVPSKKLKSLFNQKCINYNYINDGYHADLFLFNKYNIHTRKILKFIKCD